MEPDHRRLRERRSYTVFGPQLVNQGHPGMAEVDAPRNERAQLIARYLGDRAAHVSMTIGTPTSAANGVQMSTSWRGVSIETMRL